MFSGWVATEVAASLLVLVLNCDSVATISPIAAVAAGGARPAIGIDAAPLVGATLKALMA